jgi:hypothetical protein
MPTDELTESCRAWELDPSFHVNYAYSSGEVDRETENLTHSETTDSGDIEERGEFACDWITQLDGEEIELLISNEPEAGWLLHHRISTRMAEQLSDMFARIAAAAKQRMITNGLIREAEEARIADLDSRQGELPLE